MIFILHVLKVKEQIYKLYNPKILS